MPSLEPGQEAGNLVAPTSPSSIVDRSATSGLSSYQNWRGIEGPEDRRRLTSNQSVHLGAALSGTSKERLIRTASRLFHVRGYSSVGIQELCETAGVRRGSFYYFFPSKEALASAVLDYEEMDLLEQIFKPAFENGGEPLGRFDHFLRRLHHYHVARTEAEGGDVGGCPISNLGHEVAGHHPKLRIQAEAILDRFAHIFQAALEEARSLGHIDSNVDTEQSAERIRCFVQGLLETAKLRGDPDIIPQLGVDVASLCVKDSSR